ncbi:MAG: histidinol dehydrogenase [Candidatus Hydrothermarchaeaceae archaeon]
MLFSNLDELSKSEYGKIINRSKADIKRAAPDARKIVEDVRKSGDSALRKHTKKFDRADISDFRVSDAEFEEARQGVGAEVVEALKNAKKNIEEFHRCQKRHLKDSWSYKKGGAKLGQIVRPVESVGCYVPGGRASYPSTVLMAVVPAMVAGVGRIAVCTPPQKSGKVNGAVLAACDIAGVREVYKAGGAQAIAALAFGTESITKVDKIIGPGNVYVTAAKRCVSDEVAIDLPAGPSEVLIIADGSANPEFVALDMAAQAEHDPHACAVLVTTSKELAGAVENETKSINGAILVANSVGDAINFSNEYAPEHLQIITENPGKVLEKIKNAGSVFIGNYTPVACGDYASGTNHILPTGGFARAYSGLSIFDFVKLIPVQKFDRAALDRLSGTVIALAEAEGLEAHAKSVKRRTE